MIQHLRSARKVVRGIRGIAETLAGECEYEQDQKGWWKHGEGLLGTAVPHGWFKLVRHNPTMMSKRLKSTILEPDVMQRGIFHANDLHDLHEPLCNAQQGS